MLRERGTLRLFRRSRPTAAVVVSARPNTDGLGELLTAGVTSGLARACNPDRAILDDERQTADPVIGLFGRPRGGAGVSAKILVLAARSL